RTFFLQPQQQLQGLRDGFPIKLPGSGESPGVFADLNGDGRQEYIMGDGAGYLHAFTADGSQLPGFPLVGATTRYQSRLPEPVGAGIYAAVAVGDVTGDDVP